ncbi:ATP-binding protein [Pseudovibrio sp. JE062]|uniref:ATP-binding protein n=1 Tax=Pseudovibrio sp. JE062 TaxID=439495 RepID=UPI000186B93E|nr:ATP-binding protein [Pseudovibrio sp. JE062]EEA94526.1 sensory box sensor histidine kinase/response regulator [Pseudovibrio sp. JE062]
MTLLPQRVKALLSIKTRLLAAITLLTFATLFAGSIAWYWLDQANVKLVGHYQKTIEAIASSLQLANKSAGLVSSAPFILNLSSVYQIENEGSRLLVELSKAEQQYRDNFPLSRQEGSLGRFLPEVQKNLSLMRSQVAVLVNAAQQISESEDQVRRVLVDLTKMERLAVKNSSTFYQSAEERKAWQGIGQAANLLISAAHVTDFLSLGELRRRYHVQMADLDGMPAPEVQQATQTLKAIAEDETGLYATRHLAMAGQLEARNALFKIKSSAQTINQLVAEFVRLSGEEIAKQRQETYSYISSAQLVVLVTGVASIILALISAHYIAGYVTKNINRISRAMSNLAKGDHSTVLPRPARQDDEITRLLHSFRIFRANSIRLRRIYGQLQRKTELFETTFNCIAEGLVLTNDSLDMTAWNPRLAETLRIKETDIKAAKDIRILIQNSGFRWKDANVRPHGSRFRFAELIHDDGILIEVRKSPLPEGGAVWSFSDATDRHFVQEQARQKQKLESLGQLTGEVAHDFNNILTSISGSVGIIERKSDKLIDLRGNIQRIHSAVEMATNLTQRLLAFARKQHLEPEVIEINHLIESVAEIISLSVDERIILTTDLPEEETYVRIDPGQLESALLNLCINSSHAIAEDGTISIRVEVNGVESVSISVTDNGCGMDQETLDRVYEPFFTTRRTSAGSGLGLSMVFGFIKQSGGEMGITSEKGEGTTVTLVIPQAPVDELVPNTAITFDKPYRILLVEDDLQTLLRAKTMLQEMGLVCIEANSYGSAKVLIDNGTFFDVLFTDVQLEDGKTGWDLAEASIKACADQKVVVTSGRFPKALEPEGESLEKITRLAKPYTKEELAEALHQQLQRFNMGGFTKH